MNFELQNDETNAFSLCELINRAYRGVDGDGRWTTEHHLAEGDRITLQDIKGLINDSNVSVVAGFSNNTLVCCISVKNYDDVIELGTIAVEPDLHGQGIGKAL